LCDEFDVAPTLASTRPDANPPEKGFPLHMLTSTLKSKAVRAAAGLAAAAVVTGSSLIVGGSPAGADPKQFKALIGMGSDTTQDLMNALAGESNGTLYTPIKSSAASGSRQITSWDAIGTACVTPKAPGGTMDRPNGSSAGRRALSRALDGTPYGSAACGPKSVAGLVDFARSSAGPAAGNPDLTYIPYGRDGVSFAYYANGVATPVTSLTRAQLTTIFTTAGSHIVNGVDIVPCGIQTSSGTYSFWNSVTTATAATEDTATNACNTVGGGTRIEENDGNMLKSKGDQFVGKEVIVGYSAAKFISQSNGVSPSTLPSPAGTVDLGSISDNGSGTNLGKPYTGATTPFAPSATFFNDGVFGRNVYNVFDTSKVTGFGNADVKTLFVGATSAICSATAQSIVNTFGFLSTSSCGSTTLTGPFVTGTF